MDANGRKQKRIEERNEWRETAVLPLPPHQKSIVLLKANLGWKCHALHWSMLVD